MPSAACLVLGAGTHCSPAFPSLTVHLWGTEEVAAWLEHLSLCEYKDIFTRHDIRGSELLHLERRDLKVLPHLGLPEAPLSPPSDLAMSQIRILFTFLLGPYVQCG